MSGVDLKKEKDESKSKDVVDERSKRVSQGDLYSTIKINPKQNVNNTDHGGGGKEDAKQERQLQLGEELEEGNHSNKMVGVGRVSMDIKKSMVLMKEKLLEKLTAASVPSDALENARSFLETVVRDVTAAAQGLTKEALHKIKSQLTDMFPSLSPSLTSKMVDDAEKETTEQREDGEKVKESEGDEKHSKVDRAAGKAYMTPASSFFSSALLPKAPFSRL